MAHSKSFPSPIYGSYTSFASISVILCNTPNTNVLVRDQKSITAAKSFASFVGHYCPWFLSYTSHTANLRTGRLTSNISQKSVVRGWGKSVSRVWVPVPGWFTILSDNLLGLFIQRHRWSNVLQNCELSVCSLEVGQYPNHIDFALAMLHEYFILSSESQARLSFYSLVLSNYDTPPSCELVANKCPKVTPKAPLWSLNP